MAKPFPANPTRIDPYKNFKFRLEIDGVLVAGFRECSGLDAKTESAPRSIEENSKYSNITLKNGVTDDKALLKWAGSPDAKTQRRNGSIILMDEDGVEKTRWNFAKGWPMKWTGPTFNTTANDVAIETLELGHEGLASG